jgi:hypothetical protein
MTSIHTTPGAGSADALEELHAHYVEAVNAAVAEDRMDLVESLAHEYDDVALSFLVQQDLHAA